MLAVPQPESCEGPTHAQGLCMLSKSEPKSVKVSKSHGSTPTYSRCPSSRRFLTHALATAKSRSWPTWRHGSGVSSATVNYPFRTRGGGLGVGGISGVTTTLVLICSRKYIQAGPLKRNAAHLTEFDACSNFHAYAYGLLLPKVCSVYGIVGPSATRFQTTEEMSNPHTHRHRPLVSRSQPYGR